MRKRKFSPDFYKQPNDNLLDSLINELSIAVNDLLKALTENEKGHLKKLICDLSDKINLANRFYNLASSPDNSKNAVPFSRNCGRAITGANELLEKISSQSIILSTNKKDCFDELQKIINDLKSKNDNLRDRLSKNQSNTKSDPITPYDN